MLKHYCPYHLLYEIEMLVLDAMQSFKIVHIVGLFLSVTLKECEDMIYILGYADQADTKRVIELPFAQWDDYRGVNQGQ